MDIPEKLRQAYHNDLTDVPLLLDAADEIDRLKDVASKAIASLAAAISLLERSPKTGAPSDKMFDLMLEDYRGSLARAQAAIGNRRA